MKRRLGLIASIIVLAAQPLGAHHPAEDVTDEDIYVMIDENVADTPHATLTFDDMGNTIITTDSVSDAEDLLSSTLLAALSLLDDGNPQVETSAEDLLYFSEQAAYGDMSGDVLTITITFGDSSEPDDQELSDMGSDEKRKRWTERDDWGRPVQITINRLLPLEPRDGETD